MGEPVFVSIKERYRLNHPSSEKETYHIVLDLSGHDLSYSVGDCVGVFPHNHPDDINAILHFLQASGQEPIQDREGKIHLLKFFLQTKVNLARVTKKLANLFPEAIVTENIWVAEFLATLPSSSILVQTFCDTLAPMIPRFYSIASSMSEVGQEAHLTVALTKYDSGIKKRFGICSHFLCSLVSLDEKIIPIYIQKTKEFTLHPESDTKPVIMIGPGTGVAPFRGFMQERMKSHDAKKSWLFFGERHSHSDFYYKEFWKDLETQGKLRLEVAFSRDQEHKVYVQDKMLEHATEIWKWLQEGSLIYVCGDASRMAKDVEIALQKIIENQGKLLPEEAKLYVKNLRKEKRYLRDVY